MSDCMDFRLKYTSGATRRIKRIQRKADRKWEGKAGPMKESFMPCEECGRPHDRRENCPE